jgi:hypothetical protein
VRPSQLLDRRLWKELGIATAIEDDGTPLVPAARLVRDDAGPA